VFVALVDMGGWGFGGETKSGRRDTPYLFGKEWLAGLGAPLLAPSIFGNIKIARD
jgi:hypothetical protein